MKSQTIRANRRIAITTGDTDGIGFEVASKALLNLGQQRGFQFVVYCGTSVIKRDVQRLKKAFNVVTCSHESAFSLPFSDRDLLLVCGNDSPAHWVELAAQACLKGRFQALVTGPLSKHGMQSDGFKELGHTELLARVSNTPDLFMSFVGSQFSVLLVTGHVELEGVASLLTAERLNKAIEAAQNLKSALPAKKRKGPIAVLGLNPHSGEKGLLGSHESSVIEPCLKQWRKRGVEIVGPLVPDAAFIDYKKSKYSVYLAMYHDQGLIPFKMIHGYNSGVHLTMGLPFIRTSVDHGTAKEIFGKNQAHYGSMKDAIMCAMQLSKADK